MVEGAKSPSSDEELRKSVPACVPRAIAFDAIAQDIVFLIEKTVSRASLFAMRPCRLSANKNNSLR